ncbi:MAG: poly(3-hydroxybutyrate) depolymerase, partial [Zoogloea sp.]|nr:poly(3-hydroxybutyrate) depolymerase [Zoogloea sp.]
MARRKSPLVSALFKLTRAGVRQSTKIGKAATRQGIAAGGRLASSARHVMSGIATPADAPATVTGGRWHEGRWGLGPLAMRRYRLFIPSGASARRPIPLLLLLHGCAQDTAAFAASTRCAAVARERGFAVLMPEQAQEANPQRC